MVDWDDGTPVEWDGPYGPGNLLTLNHTWAEKGSYQVQAKLKDPEGEESDWGSISVFIPKNKAVNNLLLSRFINHFPLIKEVVLRLLNL